MGTGGTVSGVSSMVAHSTAADGDSLWSREKTQEQVRDPLPY
jgi:hypothetical protein